MNKENLRVCYFGTYRINYARNHIIRTGLQRNNVEIVMCHEPLWHSVEDRVEQVSGGWRHPKFWWRVIRTYGKLLYKYFRYQPKFDIMLVGYPGQFDVLLARLLCWWAGKPLAWDILMSIYLVAIDRKLDQNSIMAAKGIRVAEWLALRLADGLIIDTESYARWLSKIHNIARNRFCLVPLGADSDIFLSSSDYRTRTSKFQIVYYGSFIPNHGVLTIIEAAKRLMDKTDIHFSLIGEGPDYLAAVTLAKGYNLTNVTFHGWLMQEDIQKIVMDAQLCLGVFGTTAQSLITIHNKIYECMAMARPVLSGDSVTVRTAFEHGKHLYICERDNPQALAQAIIFLAENPQLCAEIAENGHTAYQANYTLEKIGARFKQHLLEIVG